MQHEEETIVKMIVQQQVNDEPAPPTSLPVGDLDAVTDMLGGFRGRRALTHTLVCYAHICSLSRGKSAALFGIKNRKRIKEVLGFFY